MDYSPTSPLEVTPSGSPQKRSIRVLTIALAATIAVLVTAIAIVAAVALRSGGGDDQPAVTLQSVGAITENPFTPTVAVGGEVTDPATLGMQDGRGVRGVPGTAAGLYGTTGSSACNSQLLVNYLAKDQGASKAWAAAQGISDAQIPYYVNTLTPVVTRTDAWVTNNQYRNSQAEPYQSVLQSGTPVLVDRSGVPRVQCASGSPLAPPVNAPLAGYKPNGKPWKKYRPKQVTAVHYRGDSAEPVGGQGYETGVPIVLVSLDLVDLRTGAPCKQPVGGDISLSGLPPIVGSLPDPVRTNTPFVARTDVAARSNGLERADSAEPLPIVTERAHDATSAPTTSAAVPGSGMGPVSADTQTDTQTDTPTTQSVPSGARLAPPAATAETSAPVKSAPGTSTPEPSTSEPSTPETSAPVPSTPETPTPTTPAYTPPVTTPSPAYTPPPVTTPAYTPPVTTPAYTPPPVTTPAYTPPPVTTTEESPVS